jgi:GAF domain-containing protein
MFNRLREQLFTLRHTYTNAIERQRAFGLLFMTWTLVAVWAGWIIIVVTPLRDLIPSAVDQIGIPLIAIPMVAFFTYAFVQQGRLKLAAWLFVTVLAAGIVPPILGQFDANRPTLTITLFLVIPLVAAGLVLDRRSTTWVAIFLLAVVGLRAYVQTNAAEPITIVPAAQTPLDVLFIGTAFVLVYTFLYLFNGAAERLNESAFRAADLMREAAGYINAIKDSPDETALLARSIDVVRDHMKYPVTQIYLFNEEGTLVRRMRSGLGRQEVGAAIRLRPADDEVLAEVRGGRAPVIVREGDARQSHLIAPAHSSVTIPLLHEGQVVGALDVQSSRSSFTAHEVSALQLVADQTTFALIRGRAINDLEQTLRDQVDLAARFQSQLYEMRQTAENVIGSDWTRYLEGRAQTVFGFDLARENVSDAIRPIAATDIPDYLRPALARGEVVIEENTFEQTVNVPITFRGEILGAMAFAVPKNRKLNERQLEMARTVADRLAVALENTRLFEQTQAQAYRERKASQAAGTLIGATDVRAVINVAAQTFNEAMGAIYTRVYLQPELLTTTRGEEAK